MIKQTAGIFEILSKGEFITSNSTSSNIRQLYDLIEDNYTELYDYFKSINYLLEKGDEYFYFTREESKAEIKRKLEAAKKWIDILDFLKTYDSSISSGCHFDKDQISTKVKVDADLKDKLLRIRNTSKKDVIEDKVEFLINELAKGGYIELENEYQGTYKVVASFNYIEKLIMSINITEDNDDETSK